MNRFLRFEPVTVLEFDETERGRTVYIALSWQNERGLIGQWSEIQNAVIP
ncbi:MAG: hypothetical protein LBC76_09910 [Treponema sp.]|nr:hypothetical protein [Treponema sp.]